jgi:hypothetical protein
MARSRSPERPSYADYFRYLAGRGEFGAVDVDAELRRYEENVGRQWSSERTRPDGRVIEVKNNPVPGGGLVLIYSDITERKEAEARLRAARDTAEAGRRIAVITSSGGFAELILDVAADIGVELSPLSPAQKAEIARDPRDERFVSVEPMLEPIREVDLTGIDWVICGGETDPMKKGCARLMDPDWARRLRDDCAEAGVAFFMKQMTDEEPIPDDLLVRQFPR